MASKLFNKLGVGKKHKSADLEPSAYPEQTIAQQIEACVEYSLPPDCEEDNVYCEPADSLNTLSSTTSSTHSPSASNKGTSDSDTLSMSVLSMHSDSSATKLPNITERNSKLKNNGSVCNREVTASSFLGSVRGDPSQNAQLARVEAAGDQVQLRDGPSGRNNAADADPSFAIYMNDSQIQAARIGTNKTHSVVPKLDPESDPRNSVLYPPAGDEYESPWSLEAEIQQVTDQIQNPSLGTNSTHSMASRKSVKTDTKTSMSRSEHTPGLKVDYDSMSGPSHKIKQPNVHRHSSKRGSPTPGPGVINSVLVEGEWREAKPGIAAHQHLSSPDLASPPQILSQPVSRTGANSATNVLYDKSNAADIKVMLRYNEEKPKLPCAQPRVSFVPSAPVCDGRGQVYENITIAKKQAGCKDVESEGVYDDPWSSEQMQEELFHQLEQNHQNPQKPRRASEDICSENKKDVSGNKRLTDLPSESSSYNGRRFRSTSATLASDKSDKLSPRALPPIKTPGPPLPQSTPGQLHTYKPVLVQHRHTPERQGSYPVRSTSAKKTHGPLSEGPECHHRKGLTVDKNVSITQQPWYHGTIQRFQAEDLLRKQPDGSFLIRESSNSPKDKTLSLKNLSGFIHIKVVHQPDGTVVLGQFSHPFKSIMEMVEYYSRHKVNIKGAEHTYLEIPVMR